MHTPRFSPPASLGLRQFLPLLPFLIPLAHAATIAEFTFVTDTSNTAAGIAGIQAVSAITSGPGAGGTAGAQGYTQARGYTSAQEADTNSSRSPSGNGGTNGSFYVRMTGADGLTLEQAINGGRTITPPAGATQNFTTGGGDYFSFTVTVATGYQLNLSGLSFTAAKGDVNSPSSVGLLTSVNGFTAGAAVDTFQVTTVSATGAYQAFSSTGITQSAYDSLGAATYEFRFYVYNAAGLNNPLRFDNILLTGDLTTIPETSSALLAMVSGAGLILRRFRR